MFRAVGIYQDVCIDQSYGSGSTAGTDSAFISAGVPTGRNGEAFGDVGAWMALFWLGEFHCVWPSPDFSQSNGKKPLNLA
jgi:hypothetical protein